MTTLRDGAKKIQTGKGQQTFKSQSQSGLVVNEVQWPILTAVGEVPWSPFAALREELDFETHEQTARRHGFELFVKRARIGKAKHVRVRPRFDNWSATGTVTVFDDKITKAILETMLMQAGTYCGLGDWRPGVATPGPFGRFGASLEALS